MRERAEVSSRTTRHLCEPISDHFLIFDVNKLNSRQKFSKRKVVSYRKSFAHFNRFSSFLRQNTTTAELQIPIYFCKKSKNIKGLYFRFSRRQETQISSKLRFESHSSRSRPIRLQFLFWRVNEAAAGWRIMAAALSSLHTRSVLRDSKTSRSRSTVSRRKWLVPSRPHVNPLEAKPHENSWPPRLPERAPQPLAE